VGKSVLLRCICGRLRMWWRHYVETVEAKQHLLPFSKSGPSPIRRRQWRHRATRQDADAICKWRTTWVVVCHSSSTLTFLLWSGLLEVTLCLRWPLMYYLWYLILLLVKEC